MATGIRDKVAIIGMGCTHFGERWDMGGFPFQNICSIAIIGRHGD